MGGPKPGKIDLAIARIAAANNCLAVSANKSAEAMDDLGFAYSIVAETEDAQRAREVLDAAVARAQRNRPRSINKA